MNDEEIKKILLERACREIDSLDSCHDGDRERKLQRLAYADQLILLLDDFNKYLCSTEIKGVLNILGELYKNVNTGDATSEGVRHFMTAFYKAKQESAVFPSVDIVRNAVKIAVECTMDY